MQRHATLTVPLTTAHLGTAETTGALDTDALGAGLAGGLDSLAHSATEGNAALELLSDGLSNEVGVELGALDLDNVDGELALGDASDLLELGAEGIDLGTLLTDNNAGASGEDDDLHLVASALDLDAGDSCAGKTLLEVLADLEIVTEGLSVILLCEPAGAPVLGDAKTEAGGVDFLTHTALRLLSRSNDDGDVGSTLQNARSGTLGAGTDALKRRTLVNIGSGDNQVVGTQTIVVLGVRNGGWYPGITPDNKFLPDKQCYAHAFVLLAASSALLAGEKDAETLLKDALELFDKRFWDEKQGLTYDTWNTEFTVLDDYRGLNANMHTVEAFLAVADAIKEEKYRIRAGRIIDHVIGWASANDWRIPEHFTKEWKADLDCNKECPADRFKPYGATPGHGIEWARLIVQWAYSSYKDTPDSAEVYLKAAEKLYNRAVEDSWNVDGNPGIVYTTDWDGNLLFMTECIGHWQRQSIHQQSYGI